jgi:hypothetical protein
MAHHDIPNSRYNVFLPLFDLLLRRQRNPHPEDKAKAKLPPGLTSRICAVNKSFISRIRVCCIAQTSCGLQSSLRKLKQDGWFSHDPTT